MSKLQVMKGGEFSEKRAEKWLKEDGAVIVQIKRDEFRCVVQVNWQAEHEPSVTFTSASGGPLYNLDMFSAMFLEMSHFYGTNRFDMGVCINDSFDLTRRTLRASTKPYDLSGLTEQTIAGKRKKDAPHYIGKLKARFWFYDLPDADLTYRSRRMDMATLAMNFPEYTATPETEELYTIAEINAWFSKARLAGHEGIMVKRVDHKWEPTRRPDSWMKLKPNDEVDGRIIGFTDGKGKFAGLIGSLICEAEDGSTFTISGMTDVERHDFTLAKAEMLGVWVTATYMERDTQGGYRHPQFHRIHEEKNA